MTAPRDPDRLIRAFLAEGQTELPDRAYDAVRETIDRTRQRVVVGPWREPRSATVARFAMAVAAVLIVAVLVIDFLPRSGGFGGVATPSPSPSPSPSPTPTPTPLPEPIAAPSAAALVLPRSGDLQPDVPYAIEDTNVTPLRFVVSVPAGWETFDYALMGKTGGGTKNTASIRAGFSPWLVANIYVDPCHWSSGGLALTGSNPTVDQLATALSQQVGRNGSTPVDVTLGGYSGKKVDLSVPTDFDKRTCDSLLFKTWLEGGPNGGGDGGYVYGPGQRNTVYILDVNGTPLVIDTMYMPTATAADKAELQAVLDSVSFEP
jgi:hypothetical protein